MARHLMRGSRLLAGILALALTFVPAATCVAAVMQTSEAQQHACCAGMNEDCADSMTAQQDCCIVQSADLGGIGRAAESAAVPVAAVSPVVTETIPVTTPPPVAFAPGVPTPSSQPTYLLVSVFRL
jgi:hypothetical protein